MGIRRLALIPVAGGLAGLALHVASLVALAADPTAAPSPGPAASPAARTVSEVLIQTNTRLGDLLVTVGLAMLVMVFLALAVAAVLKFIKTSAGNTDVETTALGGPGDLYGEALKALPELVKTPGGIGGLLLILGSVLLLGTAATESGQLADFGGGGAGATAAPSAAPVESPTVTDAPTVAPSPT